MLKHRLALGPLLIGGLVLVVWADEFVRANWNVAGAVFGPALILLALAAARELGKIYRAQGVTISTPMTGLAIAIGLAASGTTPAELRGYSGIAIVCTAGALVLVTSMVFYSRNQTTDGVVASASATMLAFVYIGLLGGFLVVLLKDHSGWVMLGVILVAKSCDIGAYFTGLAIGKHKLIPWLSPGKTWEGLFGGMATSALVGMLASWILMRWGETTLTLTLWQGAALGATFGLVGQAGDLVASILKRDAGIKDYSRAIPGFGGMMDIADSPLLVAPVAYWLLLLVGNTQNQATILQP